MRICLSSILSFLEPDAGGGQLIVHHWANGLVKLGHDVYVIYTKRKTLRPPAQEACYKIIWAGHFENRFLNMAPVFLAFLRLRGKIRIDVFLATGAEAFLVNMFFKNSKTRLLMAYFNPHPPYLRRPKDLIGQGLGGLKFLFSKRFFYLEKLCLKLADSVVAISMDSARRISKNFNIPLKKIEVVYCGVDIKTFSARDEQQHIQKDRLITVGRLDDQKGLDVLLKAVSLILRNRKVTLDIVGDGWMKERYKRIASDLAILDSVNFIGRIRQESVPDYLRNASLFVLASRSESFGLVLVEAMALGVPVISTNVGSIPEIITDGETGTLVRPDDADMLAHAIQDLLDDQEKAKRLSEQAKRHVLEKFTWDKSVKCLNAIYKERKQ